ncbi:MAG: FAD-dependent oxidoreductase [Wenzhouxiangellaceae bacterium]
MNRITIIGAGFGALTAVRTMRRVNPGIGIDLIAPRPTFVYSPGTIWIPTGLRAPGQLEIPLKRFFQRMRVRYHCGAVTGMEDGGRKILLDDSSVDNDGLIIASGGSFLDRLPGLEHSFLPCGGVGELTRLRYRLKQLESGTLAFGFAGNPKEPSAIRGGPVFEFLFGIDTWLRRHKRRDRFELVFFTPAQAPGKRLGGKAVKMLAREMRERDIRMRLGETPQRLEADRVVTDQGEFRTDLILFMPGMTGNPWFGRTNLPRSPGGLIRADEYCRAEGLEKVYVVGDAGSYAGPEWLPKQAHMANLQGKAAARNLCDELEGKSPGHRFKPELMRIVDMFDKGMLITRSEKSSRVLPAFIGFHWAKRLFEWNYLRKFR